MSAPCKHCLTNPATLTPQQRAAWVIARVNEYSEVELADPPKEFEGVTTLDREEAFALALEDLKGALMKQGLLDISGTLQGMMLSGMEKAETLGGLGEQTRGVKSVMEEVEKDPPVEAPSEILAAPVAEPPPEEKIRAGTVDEIFRTPPPAVEAPKKPRKSRKKDDTQTASTEPEKA